MTFTPIVPFGGYSGWVFLKRTMADQKEAYQSASTQVRDENYFRENISKVKTAEDLVSDRRLLKVALGAYGLDADINNRYFIKKVLQDGTSGSGALANRLANKQYLALSSEFGFGDTAIPGTQQKDFAEKTLAAYRTRQFETAVGEQNDDLRLAMNATRELGDIAKRTSSENTKWFTVMGNAPLRQVFQKALGLPTSFASIPLDQQLSTFQDKANKVFGSPDIKQFSDPEKVETLVRKFLVRSEAMAALSATSSGSIALTLLRG